MFVMFDGSRFGVNWMWVLVFCMVVVSVLVRLVLLVFGVFLRSMCFLVSIEVSMRLMIFCLFCMVLLMLLMRCWKVFWN